MITAAMDCARRRVCAVVSGKVGSEAIFADIA
jgi:hypothetical protein